MRVGEGWAVGSVASSPILLVLRVGGGCQKCVCFLVTKYHPVVWIHRFNGFVRILNRCLYSLYTNMLNNFNDYSISPTQETRS